MICEMRQAQRILKVQELFGKEEFVNFEELCQKFNASKSSIRRDLIELEAKGVLRRVHGGAISLQIRDEGLDFNRLSTSFHDEKKRIGKTTASLVQDGQTLILAGGSSVVEVAKNLTERPIQVVTNSIPVAQVFWDSKQVEVTLTGGYLYPRLGVQLGPICARKLVIVADRSKFGRDAMIHVADLSDIDQVVTDKGLDLESQQMLRENGIEYVLTQG